MIPVILFKGIFVGFALAVPIGPIGILCIRKTLAEGRLSGLIIGLGAATADLLYGCVAAFGLTFVANTLDTHRVWIRLAGGILFLILGIRTMLARKIETGKHISSISRINSYFSTAFITLTNPMTIIAYIALFAAFGLSEDLNMVTSSVLVTGVFTGSFLWFLLINSGALLFRKKLDTNGLRWMNRITGGLIFISGIFVIGSLF